jgi:porphobilinogen deaminase
MVIDVILKNLDLRGNISTRLKQCITYADDALITAQTKQTMKDTFQQLMHNSVEYGLIIN